ncbi:MAG: hypothetical protein HKO68_18325 [Desulfobacterales bacterium]|nr:hypothetical protein [Desulfobacterales bacterium]
MEQSVDGWTVSPIITPCAMRFALCIEVPYALYLTPDTRHLKPASYHQG